MREKPIRSLTVQLRQPLYNSQACAPLVLGSEKLFSALSCFFVERFYCFNVLQQSSTMLASVSSIEFIGLIKAV